MQGVQAMSALLLKADTSRRDRYVCQGPIATGTRSGNDTCPDTTAARGRIEAGMVMPGDPAASHFTTTVVPTDTRL